MTSQYKIHNHGNEVLIALRWQAAILGACIVYFILEYFFNFGIRVVEIRVLFFVWAKELDFSVSMENLSI